MEAVVLVDQADRAIGKAEKLAVHQLGKLHRAFSVFIFRKQNNNLLLLLQKRHPNKYHCGGLWSNTCCSHPKDGLVLKAATQRLTEEMGIQAVLHWVDKFYYRAELENGLIEHELDHVLIGFYDEVDCDPDPKEVSEYKWVDLVELQKDIKKQPQLYTPWLLQSLEIALSGLP